MLKHRAARCITLLLIPAVLVVLYSCSFTRTDMLELASSQPDIRIVGGDTNPGSFDSVELYDKKTKTFYIENAGSWTLKIHKLYTSDSDNMDFTIDAAETESDLEPGEQSQFDIHFKPSVEQTSDIDILIESNDPDEGLYRLNISGTGVWHDGVPPMIMVMQDSNSVDIGSVGYDFGPVDVGSSASIDFTIINHSNADYDLAVSSISFKSGDTTQFNRIASGLPRSIPHETPGNYMYFTVEFAPSAGQEYSTEVEIISDDPDYGSYTFWVQGTGIAEQNIRVLDGSNEIPIDGTIDFGTLEHRQDQATRSLTIENTGTAALNISAVAVDDSWGDFSFTGTIPIQIAPGASESIDITFEPVSSTGELHADVNIISDDPDESPYHFNVIGQSIAAQIQDIHVVNESTGNDVASQSVGHNFDTVDIGTIETAVFRIENRGNYELFLEYIAINGDNTNFRIGNAPSSSGTIDPGGNVTFEVNYAPTSVSEHRTFIHISNDDPDPEEQPYLIELCGEGKDPGTPDIAVKRGSTSISNNGTYYFNDDDDAVEWPGSISRTFTISNSGNTDLVISGLLMVSGDADDFTSNLETPVTVTPGASRDFNITFDPGRPTQEVEMRSARLQISSNDPDENPFNIDLYGWVEYDD